MPVINDSCFFSDATCVARLRFRVAWWLAKRVAVSTVEAVVVTVEVNVVSATSVKVLLVIVILVLLVIVVRIWVVW